MNRPRSVPNLLVLGIAALGVLSVAVSCDLDPTNENNPTEDQTLSTAQGIRTLTVGMQELYATDALNATIPRGVGITSREIAVNNTFSNLIEMERGGTDLSTSNANVEAIWSANYRVVGAAEDIIENAPQVNLSASTESGVVATARLFKAMALGNIGLSFEQAPTTTRRDGTAEFVPNEQVLREAVTLLNGAFSALDDTAPSDEFSNSVLSISVSGGTPVEGLRNVIHAYRARFNGVIGNNTAAITAANQVDPAITSTFSYDDQSQNPFWQELVQSEDLALRDSLGSNLTEPGDERIDFFADPVGETSTPNGLPIEDPAGFYATASTPVPLFVPGEMPLIRAEAKLNSGAPLAQVVEEIDSVRTDASGDDIPSPFGIAAGLPPYDETGRPTTEAALQTEILRQRRAELYLQGTSLADSRRLGGEVSDREDPGTFERNRNFYPYPDQEQRNNPNTPPSPNF
ncbi:RagB/SusD family nutrient uptake outer membrane protein [Salinibacter ruber]|uniref:RagB/SusD family nutrient uptake outer membrane protein n=1 Tax=Salinibacter ruber TaxID=146919 RepID=UPI002167FB5D|nr:RagB/SusD family nutrient uptake outer membrane protein [Salinibacter ruber]MCS4034384.1 hypothetical protein [Salinibacter ruber]MCS4050724.1 hypothetical protein [Salinibacter ruber]